MRATLSNGATKRSISLRLEGCAKRLSRGVRALRSDGDLACGAIGVTIVIVAILHVALDPLDMLAATTVFVLFVLFHLNVPLAFPIAKEGSFRIH